MVGIDFQHGETQIQAKETLPSPPLRAYLDYVTLWGVLMRDWLVY